MGSRWWGERRIWQGRRQRWGQRWLGRSTRGNGQGTGKRWDGEGRLGSPQVGGTGAGEGGEEVAWREVWRVVEEAGVVDPTEDAELPWTEGGGLETGEGVAVSQEVDEEDSTRLYHCSAISRRCPIH